MRIRALSVFEGVVYHSWAIDPSNPCRPTLEVEALLRPGDADAEAGPLLLSVADYIVMAGGFDAARPCLRELAEGGRIVEHLGVDHIAFPTWEPVGPLRTGAEASPADDGSPADGTEVRTLHDEPPDAAPSLRLVDNPAERPDGRA